MKLKIILTAILTLTSATSAFAGDLLLSIERVNTRVEPKTTNFATLSLDGSYIKGSCDSVASDATCLILARHFQLKNDQLDALTDAIDAAVAAEKVNYPVKGVCKIVPKSITRYIVNGEVIAEERDPSCAGVTYKNEESKLVAKLAKEYEIL